MVDAIETIKTPEPTVILVEWFDDHWYKLTKDGATHYLPSVTTKLNVVDKPSLARWRGDVGNREADLRMHEAGQRGKRLHWAREILLKGGAVVYDPWEKPVYTPDGIAELKSQHGEVVVLRTQDEMWQITKLKRQLDILKPRIIGVEERVYDIEARDAGTIDGIYWIEEGDYLVSGAKPIHLESGIYIDDFKTGSVVDDSVWLQEAPYAVMWEKIHGANVAGAICTWTGAKIKSGIPGLKTMVRTRQQLVEKDYPDYRAAVKLWERDHMDDEPATFEFPALITLGGNNDGLR